MPRSVFNGDRQIAHLACQMLVAHGIRARVVGDARSGLQGAVPIPDLAVEVVVDDADEAQARALIAKVEAGGGDEGPAWICGRCAETNEPGFEICWSCRRPRDTSAQPVEGDSPYRGPRVPEAGDDKAAAAPAPAGPPARWSDLGFMLLIAVAPVALTSAATSDGTPHGFRSHAGFAVIIDMLVAMECGVPLLLLARWRRGSLPVWGVVRPRWGADAVAGVGLGLLLVLVDIVVRRALGVAEASPDGSALPVMLPGDWPLLIVFTAMASLALEIVLCGVFFAGLERLLGSRAVALALTVGLGVLMNAGQGKTVAIGAAVEGALLTLAFAKVRRIWPIAVASTLASLTLWHLAG